MSETITFRGAHIRYCDVRHDESGVVFRIHMTSEFTDPIMDSMEWEDPGDSVTEAKLGGVLSATHMILTPGDKQLKQHELQIDLKDVTDFKLVAITKDEVTRRELRFKVRTVEAGTAAKVENYLSLVGAHQGTLKVSYVKQENLPLEQKEASKQMPLAPDSAGCAHCDDGIDLDGTGQRHVNGQVCPVAERNAAVLSDKSDDEMAPATLASAREAAGGTHARRARTN